MTKLDLPVFGMGCAHLGNLFSTVSEAEAAATLDAAWAVGVRYFDTAPWYGHGLSELRLGAMLRGKDRDQFRLSTKVGRVYDASDVSLDHVDPWQAALPYRMRYDYTADGFAASLAQSRLRLGIPQIDALVIHDLDHKHHGDARDDLARDMMESGLPYLKDLKKQGQVSAIGMGINATEDFADYAPLVDVDFFLVAMPYTLLDQTALDGPMQTCLDRGIKVVIGAPYASGLLVDPSDSTSTYGYQKTPEAIRQKALAIKGICDRYCVSLAAAALRFPLLHPAVAAVIPGATAPAHVEQNAALIATDIPAALWADLKSENLIAANSPTGEAT